MFQTHCHYKFNSGLLNWVVGQEWGVPSIFQFSVEDIYIKVGSMSDFRSSYLFSPKENWSFREQTYFGLQAHLYDNYFWVLLGQRVAFKHRGSGVRMLFVNILSNTLSKKKSLTHLVSMNKDIYWRVMTYKKKLPPTKIIIGGPFHY